MENCYTEKKNHLNVQSSRAVISINRLLSLCLLQLLACVSGLCAARINQALNRTRASQLDRSLGSDWTGPEPLGSP